MYEERPSTIAGAVVWRATSRGGPARILPDGCIDVIVTDGRAVVAGPDRTARWHTGTPGATSIAIRFAPGQAPGVLGVRAIELVGTTVPLQAVLGERDAAELVARMTSATDPWSVLERRFAGPAATTADRRRTATVGALRRGDSVDDVADALGWSPRQLHRRSLDWFGYGPKHLARVLRLQAALDALRRGRPVAATAAELGYVDQPHLHRAARELAGAPLRDLVRPQPSSAA